MRRLAIALAACALAFTAAAAGPATIEPKALGERIAWADQSLFVLDVRTPEEYAAGHLPGAVNIPHGELASRIAELVRRARTRRRRVLQDRRALRQRRSRSSGRPDSSGSFT